MYYDIYKVFNSTLIEYSYKRLPSETVEFSNELASALNEIYSNIKSGNIKYNLDILSNDIYVYINELHELIKKMINNLDILTHTLVEKNNTFTQITNYYLNNTSSSYINIIQNIRDILNNYFIKEYEEVFPKIKEIMNLLELNSNETLKEELNSLQNLYINLKQKIYSINLITKSELQNVLSNLESSLQYPTNIIEGIKNYINEILNLKENGYFISNEEINNFNNSFNNIITEAKKVAKIMDDVQIIDKVFDKIMIKFREGYIYTVKFMEEIKTGNFTLEEDILNTNLFNNDKKNQIENELKVICDNILNAIKTENNIYNMKIKNLVKNFSDENLEELNDIIYNLDVLLSDEVISNIAQSFELSLNSSLENLINITNKNIILSKQYFAQYHDIINNSDKLLKILSEYGLDNDGIVYGRKRTSAYLSKYNIFIANFNYSEEYLSNQLYFDISNIYRETFSKIKEKLQSIINNRLFEKFLDFSNFVFFVNHIRIIGKIKARIDKYFSSDIFNEKYSNIIKEKINSCIEIFKIIKNYINDKHNSIKIYPTYEDYSNDICVTFRRKVCYGCTNCVSYSFFEDNFCFELSPYQYNHLSMVKISFDTIQNFSEFNLIFNKIDNNIKEKNERYNDIINNLDLNISLVNKEELKKNTTNNYLQPLNDWVILILKQQFENILLISTYNYYKQNLESKLGNIFTDISKKWKSVFMTLVSDIKKNEDDIKYSMYEFTNMAENYKTIIETDPLENYFNSIILLENSEFNYMIS